MTMTTTTNDMKNSFSSKFCRKRQRITTSSFAIITIKSIIIFLVVLLSYVYSFSTTSSDGQCVARYRHPASPSPRIINSQLGMASGDDEWGTDYNAQGDWQNRDSKTDSSFWSSFEPSPEDENEEKGVSANKNNADGDENDEQELQDDSELWLDMLANISAEEVEFNAKENDRADKVRQMQEWGFDDNTIKNTYGVEIDDTLETKDEVTGMKEYRETLYWEDEEDLKTVESHTKVPKDAETGEVIRLQSVYVDEHSCIGCTNCATIAQSTFFMEDEHGRARVFEQWGDDDETIAIAIQTCPVDCIHYIPYDELVKLEVDRRGQNINSKARLVNQGEYAHMASAGGSAFTAPQEISGNFGSRCSNCPTRGCKDCPMFGIGKNPEFEKKEKIRLERIGRNRLKKAREEEKKSVDL
jgi:ferredoxin